MRLRGVSNATRQHFRRDGIAKKQFETAAAAEEVRSGNSEMSVYRCSFCKQWHVGRKETDRQRRIRRKKERKAASK